VLARVMADVPVTARDIMDMGAGGLLAEIPTRPSPREGKPKPQRAPFVVAVVLAAGQSSRMGSNKLLADLGGQPMIRRSVAAMRQAADQTIVVTGRDAGQVAAALEGLPVTFVHNPDFAEGLSTSLRAGIAALPPGTDAAVIALGDMPLVSPDAVRRLIAAYSPAEHRSLCVPVFGGERGNPVLWGRQHFDALKSLTGDKGARALFDQYTDEIVEVAMPDDAVLKDADTPEALEALRSK
jgi:molybdenum cofactor cytidylyltransferase